MDFGRVRKITKSDNFFRSVCLLSVRPSVRMEQLGSNWTDFYEIWSLSIFQKPVKKIQNSLKSDETNGNFTWIYT
jgi:hypothetical protein